jgi:hypothetical protein
MARTITVTCQHWVAAAKAETTHRASWKFEPDPPIAQRELTIPQTLSLMKQ